MKFLTSFIAFAATGLVLSGSATLQASRLPGWAKEVGAQTEPPHKLKVKVTDFGATGGGLALDTRQIQAAIDSCANRGGGRVDVAPGVYLTGALFVKSNVELHLAKGAILKAINDVSHFPEIPTRVAGIEMAWPSAVVNIIGEENASVTGGGVIDGDGKYLWDTYWEMRRDYEKRGLRWIVDYDCKRVRSLLVSNSRNITVRGLTFQRSGFWTIQFLYSSYCTASGITIRNNLGGQGPSTDGIDIDSSHHILVEKCDIDCNDDNICLKAGRDADGLRVNRPTEYVLIRQCTARRGAGLMTCGSETSGSIRHIWCCDSRALGTSAVMRVKSAATRGGIVEYIGMSHVRADSVRFILHCDMNWNPSYSYSALPPGYEGRELPAHWQVMLKEVAPGQGMPVFRHISLSGIKGRNTGAFIQCTGHPQSVIDTVELDGIDVESQFASTISHTRILRMKKVRQLIIDN